MAWTRNINFDERKSVKKLFCFISFLIICSTANTTTQAQEHKVVRDPQKVGDVVGRDLDIPTLGRVGHVGVFTGKDVLEVLNENPVIQRNSLKKFQELSPYWGARGTHFLRYFMGPKDNQIRKNLIDIGWNQKRYSPRYTTSATWQEGVDKHECVQWQMTCGGIPCVNGVCSCGSFPQKPEKGDCLRWNRVKRQAIFRCDTFVNFMFLKQTGSSLVKVFLPRNIYNAMPYDRVK